MEKLLALSKQYRRLAYDDIAEAELLADSHFYLGAISRAYYACLHAMHFLLALKGIQTKSHRQTHVAFRQHFIKSGEFGKEISMLIDQLFSLRQSSDYDPLFEIEPQTLQEMLQQAKSFVTIACR